MSKKQSGAAPGEELEPQAGEGRGWFGQLRAQPGFRTASIAFVLTVVLGIGSTAAYAYWSQKNTVTQTVTTVRQELPVLTGKVECSYNRLNVIMIWPKLPTLPTLPTDAAVIMTINVERYNQKTTFDYVVNTSEPIRLISVPDLEANLKPGSNLTVAFRTAYIDGPVPAGDVKPIDSRKIMFPTLQTGAEAVRYSAVGTFYC